MAEGAGNGRVEQAAEQGEGTRQAEGLKAVNQQSKLATADEDEAGHGRYSERAQ